MKRKIILYLSFLVLFSVVYSPVLYFNFPFHDDTTFWVKLKEFGFNHFFFDICISQCRYGDALLLNLENLFVHHIVDLKILRWLGIMVSSSTACLLFMQLRRLAFSDIQAFLVISAMFFLPGFAVLTFYSIGSFIFAICIFLSCWSFNRAWTSKGVMIPMLTFLFAITIYPPAAMMYWTMAGVYLLFAQDREGKVFNDNISRMMLAGLTSLLIYAVSVFVMHYYFANKIINPLYNPYDISHDWINKCQWFVREPVGNALNLWDIFPKKSTSIIVLGLIGFSAILTSVKKKIPLSRLWQIALFIFILLLTFLPNLAAKENAAFYRCLIALTSLIWFVLVWAIFQWINTWRLMALLSLIVTWAGILTFHHVLYDRVLPSAIEWNAYTSMAESIRLRKVDGIHIILPNHHFIKERYDEFGVISSHYNFDTYQLLCAAFNEAGWQETAFPPLFLSYPNDDMLIELNAIYIKKMPDGKWASKIMHTDDKFHDIQGPLLGNKLEHLFFYNNSPQPISVDRHHWYLLNMNDYFAPSNDYRSTNLELAEAYNNRGNIYFTHGNLKQAIVDYSRAISFKGNYEEAFYNRGYAYYKEGDLPDAIANFSKAIEINPQDTVAYNNRSACINQLKIKSQRK
jgi:hypothetical protein